jgi:YHS domain-containing protein
VAFLGLFGLLYWLYRHRAQLGGGRGYAIDPVCGMQVATGNAPAHCVVDGEERWFCSDRCREHFMTAAAIPRKR